MAMAESLDDESVMRDTGALLAYLDRQASIDQEKLGTLGYCMGGGFAVCAACAYPTRIRAAASIHGGKFLTQADSPAVIEKSARSAFYVAVAEVDRRHTSQTTRQLEAAFDRANVPHSIELYPGTSHGFAMADFPVYSAEAAQHHWDKLKEFFGSALH